MGKKGKRSKQKDAKKEAEKIIRESNKLLDEALNDERRERLYSKAANQYREVIQLLDSKKELLVYTRDQQLEAYLSLMNVEYRRQNYKAALDCYHYFMANSRHLSSRYRGFVNLFHQLSMLRLNGQESKIADFINFISQEGEIASLVFIEAIFAFRAHKMYDAAIKLEITCGPLMRKPLESKLSLAMTYLEYYRIEFHKRSDIRKKDFFTMNSLITSMMEEYPVESNVSAEYMLVLAQWYYLTHTLAVDKSKKEKTITSAFSAFGMFLYSIVVPDERCTKIKQDKCYTCGQAVTPTEVQYVCSGCRVACYCSIDHQRATWKKEAVSGMRIGHEILCPLYKTFRKHLFQKESEDIDNAKELRIFFHLERECLKFLEYGLGLKNKCFPCEYRKLDDEGKEFYLPRQVSVTMD
ncbi:predicted protein [Chaetoceros tenuissimus]|uniref:MYND-type domain-containing protein n=1 Tax=Chaetoceros tenuissimus TaxID=426638 RepID=A0AAD3HA99_9STRA|nr:predicted protein [Chaetoceros tenuissimus]